MADEMSGGDTSDVSADIPEDVPEDATYPEETLDEIRNAITNESSSYEYEGVTD